jgi:hypothetical protein
MCGSTLALAEEQQVPRLRSWAALRPSYFARETEVFLAAALQFFAAAEYRAHLLGISHFSRRERARNGAPRIYSSCVLFALFGRDL